MENEQTSVASNNVYGKHSVVISYKTKQENKHIYWYNIITILILLSYEWVRERGLQGRTYILGVYNQSTGQEKASLHLAEAINKSFDLYILTLKEVSQHLVY